MRILMLVPQSLERPTARMKTVPTALALARRGHRVHLALLHHDPAVLCAREVELGPGVTARYVGFMPVRKVANGTVHLSATAKVVTTIRAAFGLAREVVVWPSDVVHLYKTQPHTLPAALLARFLGRPLLLEADDLEEASNELGSGLLRAAFRLAERATVALAGAVATTSRFLRDRYRAMRGRGRPIVRVPLGVDASIFARPRRDGAAVRRGLGIPETAPLVLYAGTVHPGSGHRVDVLLRAFACLRDRHPRARLVVAGTGDLPWAQAIADGLGLGDRARFPGGFDLADYADLLHAADVVVDPVDDSPVNRAKTSTRIYAAMAAGRAVVTGATGDRPYIAGRAGWVVRPDDPDDLAAALGALLADAAARERLGQAGRVRVRRFGWDRVVRRYERLYAALLPAGGVPCAGTVDAGKAMAPLREVACVQ